MCSIRAKSKAHSSAYFQDAHLLDVRRGESLEREPNAINHHAQALRREYGIHASNVLPWCVLAALQDQDTQLTWHAAGTAT
jgi:hypothetical protein